MLKKYEVQVTIPDEENLERFENFMMTTSKVIEDLIKKGFINISELKVTRLKDEVDEDNDECVKEYRPELTSILGNVEIGSNGNSLLKLIPSNVYSKVLDIISNSDNVILRITEYNIRIDVVIKMKDVVISSKSISWIRNHLSTKNINLIKTQEDIEYCIKNKVYDICIDVDALLDIPVENDYSVFKDILLPPKHTGGDELKQAKFINLISRSSLELALLPIKMNDEDLYQLVKTIIGHHKDVVLRYDGVDILVKAVGIDIKVVTIDQMLEYVNSKNFILVDSVELVFKSAMYDSICIDIDRLEEDIEDQI